MKQNTAVLHKFPTRTLVRIAWFFPAILSVLTFLLTALEQDNFISSLIRNIIVFLFLLILNLICIFILSFLHKRKISNGKLLIYTFLLTASAGIVMSYYTDMLVDYLIHLRIVYDPKKPNISGFKYLIYAFLRSGLVTYFTMTWQVFILTNDARMNTNIENAELKVTNAQAVNQLLRQQIHPHFLFNALSTIKSLIHKQPDTAAAYVVKLSGFLRASISATQAKTATLAEEIRLSLDYLELQKIRLGNSLQYQIDVDEKDQLSTCLPVFALQSLVENAVKHNLHSEASPLHIMITVNDGMITVKNSYAPHYKRQDSIGSGLNNLSERYKYLSGEQINFHHDEQFFYVSMKLIALDNPYAKR